jgi:hypothetical protein
MFKRVLFRGAVFVGSLVATIKVLDKIEEVDKKRRAKVKSIKINSNKKDEKTEEEKFGEGLKEHGFQEMVVTE